MVVVAQFWYNSFKLNSKFYLLLTDLMSQFCPEVSREENLMVLRSRFLCELHCKIDLTLSSFLFFNCKLKLPEMVCLFLCGINDLSARLKMVFFDFCRLRYVSWFKP